MCLFAFRLTAPQFREGLRADLLRRGALLLGAWSLWALAGHVLEVLFVGGRAPLHEIGTQLGGVWEAKGPVDLVYYVLKMDHLLLVPSLVFFYLASRPGGKAGR